MEFFRIKHDIPFMSWGKYTTTISLVTFLVSVFFLVSKGLNLGGLTAGLQEGLDNLVAGLTGQAGRQSPNAARTLAAAAGEVPDPDAKLVTLSVDPDGDVPTGKHAANPSAESPEDSGLAPKHAAPEDEDTDEASEEPTKAETPSEAEAPAETPAASEAEAEPEVEAEAPVVKKPTVKKNPLQNLVRDITNAFTPKKKKPAATASTAGDAEADAKKSETTKSEVKTSDTKKSEAKKSETKKADKEAA